jgi:predicted lipoprotein with Yx(FWY)xxD motif
MADFLEKGGRLVLFAEGRMSRTGSLMKLFDGTGFLIQKTGAKVITCYLRSANRQRFATHSGWKLWFPRITTHYSEALVAPDGMTLYVFTQDSPGETTCFEGCEEAWPPLTVEEGQSIEGGEGVDGEFSTVDRGDGTLQVAYEGYPLYFYAADSEPGDATGEGVGGVWFIAKASGEVPEG